MWEGHGMGGGFMWIFWIFLIAVIVWGIGAVSKGASNAGGYQASALDILKERYARGEIDQQEYEQKRKDLDG